MLRLVGALGRPRRNRAVEKIEVALERVFGWGALVWATVVVYGALLVG